MWVLLAVLSAVCLALYDICKKGALIHLDVYSALLGSILIMAFILFFPFLLSRLCPEALSGTLLYVPHVSAREHILILLKSCIVLASWVCAYYAMRRLPLTVITPLNATRPMWTLLGALLIFGEVLNSLQWMGVILALISFAAFAILGLKPSDSRSQSTYPVSALIALVLAILFGAVSGLYDKHLMRSIDHNAVQVFYIFYQAAILLLFGLIRRLTRGTPILPHIDSKTLAWLVGIALGLILSDYVYLLALTDVHSLIAVVSLVRRGSVLITFTYGAIFLREHNIRPRLICLLGILAAMILLLLGSL